MCFFFSGGGGSTVSEYPLQRIQIKKTNKKTIHLCIMLWILVQSYTDNDLILFGSHCDLYIMVQRFCLVSLTISNRKTSYRSLKETAGSTSCPWTTILVFLQFSSCFQQYIVTTPSHFFFRYCFLFFFHFLFV